MRAILVLALMLILTACTNSEEQEGESVQNDNILSAQSNEGQSTVVTNEIDNEPDTVNAEPVDFEAAVDTWEKEINEWYESSGMGAVEVVPVEENYSNLHVVIHDNMKKLNEGGQLAIYEGINSELKGLVKEIFGTEEDIKVNIEFQDGTPLEKESQ